MGRLFLRDEEGLETVEYAIIAGIIVGGAALTIGAIAVLVGNRFTALESALKTTPTGT
jgi:Flp pilus assembly pilin Flp